MNINIGTEMYPSMVRKQVREMTTLGKFLLDLGQEYLYAFKRMVLCVTVNGNIVYSIETALKLGDEVILYPIVAGG